MTMTLEQIEQAVSNLPKDKLEEFRSWYEKFDSDSWDLQIKADSENGNLDFLVNQAIQDHQSGKTKKL